MTTSSNGPASPREPAPGPLLLPGHHSVAVATRAATDSTATSSQQTVLNRGA